MTDLEDTGFEIEELRLESETVHKSYLAMLFQRADFLEFGENDGLAAIRHVGHGEFEIVRGHVEIKEDND